MAVPAFDEAGRPTTNIGATDMRNVARPSGRGLPVGTRAEDAERAKAEGRPIAKIIAPAPEWITRWQTSATPAGRPRPWVKAYRVWRGRVAYESGTTRVGPSAGTDWIDMWHKSGFKIRHKVPEGGGLATAFVALMGQNQSVGQWVHKHLLDASGHNIYPTEPL